MILLEKADVELLYRGTQVHLSLDKKDAAEIVNTVSRLKPGTEYDVEFKERARRSLNANAYHWQLVSKIAEANGISKYEAHNVIMADYGTDWTDEDGKKVYVLMKDDGSYLRKQTEHYRPTDATEDRKGTQYRWMILLKPSHLLTPSEMSALITGTVQEAQSLDIEVRTPDEIARMVATWKEGGYE